MSPRTFPATDPEPQPPSPWRYLPVALGLCLLAAAGVLVWRLWPQGGDAGAVHPGRTHPAGPTLRPPGRILVYDGEQGLLGYTDPHGDHYSRVPGDPLGGYDGTLAPDASVFLSSSGVLAGALTPDGYYTTLALPVGSQGQLAPVAHPWAAHGDRVVLSTVGGGHADVSSVARDGSHQHPLGGNASDAAADPTRDGALVAVAGRRLVGSGQNAELPTTRLELRRPGHRRVLVRTPALADALGLPRQEPYAVRGWFSPDGKRLAATLESAPGSPPGYGLVVLDRHGHTVFHRRGDGPFAASWSHDSTRLAFSTRTGHRLTIVHTSRPGAPVSAVPVPQQDAGPAPCLWSPTDRYLLCTARAGVWLLADTSAGTVEQSRPQRASLSRLPVGWRAGKAGATR